MAEVFLAPDSVNRIRSVVERGAENPFAAALARMFMQTGVETAPR
jgi:hypothetical protein